MPLVPFLLLLCAFLISCDGNTIDPSDIDAGNDPNFQIVANSDTGLSSFNRKVVVFDIPIFAVAGVEDAKLLHAANIMAQYLDNDEDGLVDNGDVLSQMKNRNAGLVMWKSESDLDISPPQNMTLQDLGNDETNPTFVSSGLSGRFDASLEEVLHIITHAGYGNAFPNVFSESQGSELANAMDIARGGQFTSIPNSYPDGAWYTYGDQTCDYACMVTEYFYWALTSKIGAQENRLGEIDQEWKLNTLDKLESTDTAVFAILSDDRYSLPKVLPDGSYRH